MPAQRNAALFFARAFLALASPPSEKITIRDETQTGTPVAPLAVSPPDALKRREGYKGLSGLVAEWWRRIFRVRH